MFHCPIMAGTSTLVSTVQVLVFAFGGTATCSTPRLLMSLALAGLHLLLLLLLPLSHYQVPTCSTDTLTKPSTRRL